MRTSSSSRIRRVVGLAAAWAVAGCAGTRDPAALEAIRAQTGHEEARAAPFVEAFIEFPGPREDWAGPVSVQVYAAARDVKADPEFRVAPSIAIRRRALASSAPPVDGSRRARVQLTAESVREHLASLGQELTQPTPAAPSCYAPVRVRLVRADGTSVDRQGCRSADGWPRLASELASLFIAASL